MEAEEKPYTKEELQVLRSVVEIGVTAHGVFAKLKKLNEARDNVAFDFEDFLDLLDEVLDQSAEQLGEALVLADADIEAAPV